MPEQSPKVAMFPVTLPPHSAESSGVSFQNVLTRVELDIQDGSLGQ